MTIRVRQVRINALYVCYMDDNIRFEHNSKVATLVVVEVVYVGRTAHILQPKSSESLTTRHDGDKSQHTNQRNAIQVNEMH